MDILNANLFVENPRDRNAFIIKNDMAPIAAMLKRFVPKVVMPPSPNAKLE